jgi:hypothetical protein
VNWWSFTRGLDFTKFGQSFEKSRICFFFKPPPYIGKHTRATYGLKISLVWWFLSSMYKDGICCKINFLITINIVFCLPNCTTIQQIAHKCKIIILLLSQNKVLYIHINAVYAMKTDEVASSIFITYLLEIPLYCNHEVCYIKFKTSESTWTFKEACNKSWFQTTHHHHSYKFLLDFWVLKLQPHVLCWNSWCWNQANFNPIIKCSSLATQVRLLVELSFIKPWFSSILKEKVILYIFYEACEVNGYFFRLWNNKIFNFYIKIF